MKYEETSEAFVRSLPPRKRHIFDIIIRQQGIATDSTLSASSASSSSSASIPPSSPSSSNESPPNTLSSKENGEHSRPRGPVKRKSLNGPGRPPIERPVKMKEEKIEEDDDDNDSDDDHEDDGKIYCVCKQPYNPNLWMIACDKCNEWYHGKCVHITANEARKIKMYVCPPCSEKTGQTTMYKNKKNKPRKDAGENQSPSSSGTDVSSTDQTPSKMLNGHLSSARANKKRKKVITDEEISSAPEECEPPAKRRRDSAIMEDTPMKSSPQTTPAPIALLDDSELTCDETTSSLTSSVFQRTHVGECSS